MNNSRKGLLVPAAVGTAIMMAATEISAATVFSNKGGIANTRHNLTQGPVSVVMDTVRNNYGEVCVYCHTPHGANGQINAPLWNRTLTSAGINGTYTTYDTLGTSSLTASMGQPGINSLTCLSCHDGTLGVDSVINMPGSGLYRVEQETSSDNQWLSDSWDNKTKAGSALDNGTTHMALNESGCLSCHNAANPAATDFSVFKIGTDLTDDHPIGVNVPTGRFGSDFFEPTDIATGIQFYETDGNDRADKDEIRFYDTGAGARVECASCHDPHGVIPRGSDPATTEFNPTFLRISNDGSAVCLTCHDK